MTKPDRPVSGFVPIGDVVAGVELPDGRALTPAAPQARHHFTTLRQVNELIEASEADADLGFMARLLALCSLPRTNPGDQKEYIRRNGPYALGMVAGLGNKLPFGTLPRLLLAWVCHRGGADAAPRAGPRPVPVWVHAKTRHGRSQWERPRGSDTAQESNAPAVRVHGHIGL